MATLGNYRPFFTHQLVADAKAAPAAAGVDWPHTLCASGLCLKRSDPDPLLVGNPFFVVATTADVVNGHNGIWDDRFQSWLMHVFNRLDANAPPPS